jgi:hypothetical protein
LIPVGVCCERQRMIIEVDRVNVREGVLHGMLGLVEPRKSEYQFSVDLNLES